MNSDSSQKSFERGKIRNKDYAGILRDFSGLSWGKITPTDIDGFLDFGNKAFVFIESKYWGTEIRTGQKMALERLVDACNVPSVLIVAEHHAEPGQEIDMAHCRVVRYRYKKKWRTPQKETNVKQAIDGFLLFNSKGKLV